MSASPTPNPEDIFANAEGDSIARQNRVLAEMRAEDLHLLYELPGVDEMGVVGRASLAAHERNEAAKKSYGDFAADMLGEAGMNYVPWSADPNDETVSADIRMTLQYDNDGTLVGSVPAVEFTRIPEGEDSESKLPGVELVMEPQTEVVPVGVIEDNEVVPAKYFTESDLKIVTDRLLERRQAKSIGLIPDLDSLSLSKILPPSGESEQPGPTND